MSAGLIGAEELLERFDWIQGHVERAFDKAVGEPKVSSREALESSNSAPLVPKSRTSAGGGEGSGLEGGEVYSECEYRSSPNIPLKRFRRSPTSAPAPHAAPRDETLLVAHSRGRYGDLDSAIVANTASTDNGQKDVEKGRSVDLNTMRKHMTRAYDELLSAHTDMVYIGEDVQHGGYYLVTEGLAAKHPLRWVHSTSLRGTSGLSSLTSPTYWLVRHASSICVVASAMSSRRRVSQPPLTPSTAAGQRDCVLLVIPPTPCSVLFSSLLFCFVQFFSVLFCSPLI